MIVIQMTAGDTSPNITFNFSRSDGSVVDITGANVQFIIQNPYANQHTNDADNSCTVLSSTTCTYAWDITGTDVPLPGIYNCELRILYPDGQKETQKMVISADRPL